MSGGRRAARALGSAAAMLLLLAAMLLLAPPAHAQGIESVLAPGKLSQAHAQVEQTCAKCHVRFDRSAQDGLCMDCHKDIAHDVRARTGLHGRQKQQACRSCHTEHKGREARIVAFDTTRFDHAGTEFALRGGHQKVACEKCHDPARPPGGPDSPKGFHLPDASCNACHRADDAHKGSLGTACADCHTETHWKQARFDHAKSRFPLAGKHADVKCADCHRDARYKETPLACVACHRKDDKHKAQFGDKCESCHEARSWKSLRFDHDSDTRFPLLGRHHAVKCESCHTGALFRQKLASTCIDCHRKDDKHKASLGDNCAQCHTERDWKEPAKFNHARTDFPLRGRHAEVACKDCHASAMFKEAPKDCLACHRKDDKHKGSLGADCARCHGERNWKQTSFDHAKTAYPLLGKHRAAECASCHTSANYKETPRECSACHARDDKHAGQLGRGCGACHVETDWKSVARFDHGLSRFPLLGKHADLPCAKCHASARFKDARRDCAACHAKDDKHKQTLGAACEQCHNARAWTAWRFDHDQRTRFALDGAHRGLACGACHRQPATGRVSASMACASCHARDDVHEGNFGRQCQQCHVTSSFRTVRSRSGTATGASP